MNKINKIFHESVDFLKDIYSYKFMIFEFAKRDFRKRYVGSFLGFFWSIIQPFSMMFILWIILEKVFKAGPVRGVPFFAWMVMGLIPWYFISEAISVSTTVFSEYSYLVKKTNFKVSILPLIKIISSSMVHLIFMIVGILVLILTKVEFSIYNIQFFYYFIAMIIFTLSICWITSIMQVFIKDTAHVITILIQFGFWLTPIFWDSYDLLPPHLQYIFKLNPFFYIIDGYRRSFVYHTPVWQSYLYTIYYWSLTIIFLFVGIWMYKKLKPHFADVL